MTCGQMSHFRITSGHVPDVTALLQSSLEDSQRRVSFLEAVNSSLREELEVKDARLAAMGSRLLDLISKFEVGMQCSCN